MNDPRPPQPETAARGAVGAAVRHDSAHLHVADACEEPESA